MLSSVAETGIDVVILILNSRKRALRYVTVCKLPLSKWVSSVQKWIQCEVQGILGKII